MRGVPTLLYAVTAYLAGQAAMVYFIGFSANLLVPKSVDMGGEGDSAVRALLGNVLLLALFGLQHSIMARASFKRWWTRFVPPAAERSTYLLATSAVLGVIFWFWTPIAEPVVWRIENGAGVALAWGVFGAGWLLVLASTFLIDHWELFGLRQALAHMRQRALAATEFSTPLFYRLVRHPLYVGLLLGLWSVPVMTTGRLLFALGLTIYILIGIAFEERDLVRQFGDRYRLYCEQVGMLLPRRWPARGVARGRRARESS